MHLHDDTLCSCASGDVLPAGQGLPRQAATVRSLFTAGAAQPWITPLDKIYLRLDTSVLRAQALSLGLGEQWEKVKTAYAQANRALGDIVKVTPSSKVVGDLAQFMVQNNLNEQELVDKADNLSLPSR